MYTSSLILLSYKNLTGNTTFQGKKSHFVLELVLAHLWIVFVFVIWVVAKGLWVRVLERPRCRLHPPYVKYDPDLDFSQSYTIWAYLNIFFHIRLAVYSETSAFLIAALPAVRRC